MSRENEVVTPELVEDARPVRATDEQIIAELNRRLEIIQTALFIAAREIASKTKVVGSDLQVMTKATMISLLQDAKNKVDKAKADAAKLSEAAPSVGV